MFDDDFLKAIVLEMVRTGKIDLDPLPVLAKEVKTAEDPDKWADRQYRRLDLAFGLLQDARRRCETAKARNLQRYGEDHTSEPVRKD